MRQLIEKLLYHGSPYEQVLFCYEPYDELVLMQLQQFDKKSLTSVEKEMRAKGEEVVESEDSLKLTEQTDLSDWVKVGELSLEQSSFARRRRLYST